MSSPTLRAALAPPRVVREIDRTAWRDFVRRHPDGNVFHTPEMFDVFAAAKHHQPDVWAVVSGDEILALMTPVQVSVGAPLARRLSTRTIVYGGVLHADGPAGRAALGTLLASYRDHRHKTLFTEIRNLHDPTPVRDIHDRSGFAYEEHLNYLVHLDGSMDDVEARMGSRTRKNLRRALRSGTVTVDDVTDLTELERWYGVLKATYRRARVPLADRSLFVAAYERLRPLGMARFFTARVDGHIAACSVELGFKDTVYGWYGGTDRAFGRHLPNEVLMWHVLRWGVAGGFRTYDFGGAGTPDEEYGVRNFKAKFGGQLVSDGRFRCVHSPWALRASRAAYGVYQRFR